MQVSTQKNVQKQSIERRSLRTSRGARAVKARASGEVTLLDYGAGNVRSVRNAIKKLGFTIKDVSRLCHNLPL
jgi:imidazole glycerol-phosphate synthase